MKTIQIKDWLYEDIKNYIEANELNESVEDFAVQLLYENYILKKYPDPNLSKPKKEEKPKKKDKKSQEQKQDNYPSDYDELYDR
jgi:hypothetical protein